jgi:hypothetical protein
MIGIHWQLDCRPTAAYQARASWSGSLPPSFRATRERRPPAPGPCDLKSGGWTEPKLLYTGTRRQGTATSYSTNSGDYNGAFTFWNEYEPDPAMAESQKQVAAALRGLADAAQSQWKDAWSILPGISISGSLYGRMDRRAPGCRACSIRPRI